ncbi:DUF4853 domain-containing protein [Schaalia sp. Marseille-Q2122]|uniref:DUF4853 domain-containing protein n=1 Tax=Schaalia sp. Marseille-Q2122 TaxID=2736604 RepID=UPI00158DFBCD|nr:DUF4853 domain-containing protein [Schaalia sp. Marseille-Q2122]
MDRAFGDGALPLGKRQPIEEYIDTVVPAYGAFMNELANEVGEQLYVYENSILYCIGADRPERFDLYTANTFLPKGLPVERVREIGDKYFFPIGLDHVTTPGDEKSTDIFWHDPENGGWVVISVGQRMAADAVSGIRPGSLSREYCANPLLPDWEKPLPSIDVYNTLQSGQEPQSSSPAQSGN